MNAVASPANADAPAWLAYVLRNAFIALLVGAIAVVLPADVNLLWLMGWLVLLLWSTVRLARANRQLHVTVAIAIQLSILIGIATAAHLAPVKTTERLLDRAVTLPRSRMTLEELGGDGKLRSEWWPNTLILFSVPEDERSRVIEFAHEQMTLREFVAVVEAQSTLRHRFRHCGNGYTILWGGDCSFGLYLRRPRN